MTRAPIDWNAVQAKEDADAIKGSFINLAKILNGTEYHFRLPYPHENMGNSIFMEEIAWWIGSKKYLSPQTFGNPCPIKEEIDAAKSQGDPNVMERINATEIRGKFPMPVLSRSNSFLIAGLPLLIKFENPRSTVITSTTVINNSAIIASCSFKLKTVMMDIINSRDAVGNGSPWGIFDPNIGFTLILKKTMDKSDKPIFTASLMTGGCKMDDEIQQYWEEKNLLDIVSILKKQIMPDDQLRTAIRAYLYNEGKAAVSVPGTFVRPQIPTQTTPTYPPLTIKPLPTYPLTPNTARTTNAYGAITRNAEVATIIDEGDDLPF